MKRFLIVNPFGIGDVLFTTPVIKSIRKHYPDAFIGYWCNERTEPILRNNPYIDKIFALSRGDLKNISRISRWLGIKRFLRLLSDIKKEHFEICLDFSLDYRYSLIAKILKIKKRIGLNYKNRGKFLTDKLDISGYETKHVVEYYTDLLKFLSITAMDKTLDLFLAKEDMLKASHVLGELGILQNDIVIGIAPGAGLSWGKDAGFKHWLPERFAQVADRLIEALKAKIIIFGDSLEHAIANKIITSMKNKAIDLVGKTTLTELASILDNLNLLICNDGGSLHIAKALKLKTVSIFGPVNEKVYGPYPLTDKDIVIKKELICRPCYKNFRFKGCVNNRKCLEDISVDAVYTAVRRLM
jgi:lipopolysaccharide heptosyltransferase II